MGFLPARHKQTALSVGACAGGGKAGPQEVNKAKMYTEIARNVGPFSVRELDILHV